MYAVAAALAIAFAMALCGTWAARRYAVRRHLLDQPGARRSHAVATPRGGGIAIAATWLLGWCAIATTLPVEPSLAWAVAGGLLLVGSVGWADDHRHVAPTRRLLAHAVAATWLALAIWHGYGSVTLAAVAFVSVLVLVNVWNFMDGIDGLAASQALIAASLYAVVATGPALVLAASILAVATLGFLPMNVVRARIFLGDVGSGSLGYILAVLFVLCLLESRSSPAHWPLLALPLAAFLIDSSLTLLRRMVMRERWWTPHVTHAYQRLARHGRRHWPVTLGYSAVTAAASLLAVRLWTAPAALTMAVFVGSCAVGTLVWRWAAGLDSRDEMDD